MSCKLGDKCDNVFACNILRPNVELLGCNFYKPKEPMTNEEYLKSCTTEMLAVAIFRAICTSAEMIHCEITLENRSGTELKEAIYEWLKQPHTNKE